MPPAIAAWDARVPRRVTAAAVAAALQGVFYWLILHEAIEPATLRSPTLRSPTPLHVTIFQAARPATAPRNRSQPGLPQRPAPKRGAALPPLARPITPPSDGRLAPHASIDWQQAMQREVRARDFAPAPGKRQFGFPRFPAPTAAAPRFGWDYARTHRVEELPEGGLLINLNDRCAVVLYLLLIPVCKIGHIPTDGGLFDHIHDRRSDRADGLP